MALLRAIFFRAESIVATNLFFFDRGGGGGREPEGPDWDGIRLAVASSKTFSVNLGKPGTGVSFGVDGGQTI